MLGMPEDSDAVFYRGEGCQECFHTGTRGRRAVFEILTLNSHLRRMVSNKADSETVKETALREGFVTMKENCRSLVLRGEISAAEAAKAINSTAG